MAEPHAVRSTPWDKAHTDRVVRLATRQLGVISARQLLDCGLSRSTIARWKARGRIHQIHPHVYAVGHTSLNVEGRLRAALLYAGPGAALSHTTAAWWWQLLEARPQRIHVAAGGRRPSLPDVRVHHPRRVEGTTERGLPVTTVPRTLLDLASILPFAALRRALAEAEYRRLLDRAAVESVLRHGHSGSATLRSALDRHLPRLARTLSPLEERFLALCETHGIPLPEVNARIEGLMVDALWRDRRLAVELDGHAAHATPAAIERDRNRDLTLRGAGYRVHRYTWQQVTEQPDQVATDLRAALDAGTIPPPHRR
jgi:predicted transcriptional regulator of viral defense system